MSREQADTPLHRVLKRIADRYPDCPCSGKHLGSVRSWIQTTFRNGERVTWGSDQELGNSGLTVRQMEDLAERIKDAVVQEIRGMVEAEIGRQQETCPCETCEHMAYEDGEMVCAIDPNVNGPCERWLEWERNQ